MQSGWDYHDLLGMGLVRESPEDHQPTQERPRYDIAEGLLLASGWAIGAIFLVAAALELAEGIGYLYYAWHCHCLPF